MVFFGGALGLLAIGVWIFCIIDAVTTPKDQVRLLPKLAWIAIVVLLIDLGSIAWLLAGRAAVDVGSHTETELWAEAAKYRRHPSGLVRATAWLAEGLGRLPGPLTPQLYAGVAVATAAPGLRDITSGSNGAYSAGPGWDPCTGLGVPDGQALLERLTTPAA